MPSLLVYIYIVTNCYCAAISNMSTELAVTKILNTKASSNHNVTKISLLEMEGNETDASINGSKTRFKRQEGSGAGKFTEAAKMPQIKVLRLFLTMFKNIWAASYTGGAHPFHHNVPKPIVALFKHRVVEFFFPDVGEDAIKD